MSYIQWKVNELDIAKLNIITYSRYLVFQQLFSISRIVGNLLVNIIRSEREYYFPKNLFSEIYLLGCNTAFCFEVSIEIIDILHVLVV